MFFKNNEKQMQELRKSIKKKGIFLISHWNIEMKLNWIIRNVEFNITYTQNTMESLNNRVSKVEESLSWKTIQE